MKATSVFWGLVGYSIASDRPAVLTFPSSNPPVGSGLRHRAASSSISNISSSSSSSADKPDSRELAGWGDRSCTGRQLAVIRCGSAP